MDCKKMNKMLPDYVDSLLSSRRTAFNKKPSHSL